MSGFDRALGALGRQEMLECARGLLRFLAGAGALSGSAAASGGAAGIDGRVGGRGVPATAEAGASGGGFALAAAGRAGRDVRQVRGGQERARREVFDGFEGAESAPERGGEPDGPERRERALSLFPRGRERAARWEPDSCGGSGPAFAGPERRYDSAVGARGMEMSRVSDFFRRDSRRYDAGYKRY